MGLVPSCILGQRAEDGAKIHFQLEQVHPKGHHRRLLGICSQHSEGLDGAAFPVELSSQRSFLRWGHKVTSCHSPNMFHVCQEFTHEPEAHVHWEFNLIGNAFFWQENCINNINYLNLLNKNTMPMWKSLKIFSVKWELAKDTS